LAATAVVANSEATARSVAGALPRLDARTQVIYNGVAGPSSPPRVREKPHTPFRLALVGRLSPRKGTDVAIRAVRRLHEAGHPATLRLVGSAFAGYEWFVDQLHSQ